MLSNSFISHRLNRACRFVIEKAIRFSIDTINNLQIFQ